MTATQLATPSSLPITRERATTSLKLLFGFWVLTFFYPEIFLSNTFGGPFFRIPTLLLPILIWISVQSGFARVQYWPFTILMLFHMYAAVFAPNRGLSMIQFKVLLPLYLLMTASRSLIRTPAQVLWLIWMFMASFVWFALFGIPGGRVTWHGDLDNEDAFGPLMGLGIGLYYYVAMGTREWRLKWSAYAVAAICVVGVVASFARGAVIATGAVAVAIWLRSPRKLATAAGGVVAVVCFGLAAALLFPDGEFWREMASVSEGTDTGTGQARWIMWMMAVDVWKEAPIFGVGSGNFGVVASDLISFDMDRGQWQDPAQLYNAALHSVYFQLLAEEGIAGCLLWAYMVYDFHRRIFRLCSDAAGRRWRELGGSVDLRLLALGLESAMLSFHVNGIFYNQIYIHWFWTLLTLSMVLTQIVSAVAPPRVAGLQPSSAR